MAASPLARAPAVLSHEDGKDGGRMEEGRLRGERPGGEGGGGGGTKGVENLGFYDSAHSAQQRGKAVSPCWSTWVGAKWGAE